MKVQKAGQTVDAIQWFENGDHPDDFPDTPALCPFEGRVVRYFRYPGVDGDEVCHCGQPYRVHGWIDDEFNGKAVCPGDWIVTDSEGENHRYSPSDFALNYEVSTLTLRKKPVEIEGVVWTGENDDEVMAFCPVCKPRIHRGVKELDIKTLEDGIDGRATHVASLGDYILKGVQGEFYACKPDIVALTYDVV